MRQFWIILLLSVGACSSTGPSGALTVQAPSIYRTWFDRTQQCSGRSMPYDRLEFFVVAGDGFDCPSGRCVGRWEQPNRIYIAEAYAQSEMVVRHEMLHALIGSPGHPDPPFAHGCYLTWDSWPGPTSNMALSQTHGSRPTID